MTYQEALDKFGLPASPAHREEIRLLLAQEIDLEKRGEAGEEMLRILCVQLFSLSMVEDVFLIWQAKRASFDANFCVDVQFLCGAGLVATKVYLMESDDPSAESILIYLTECEKAGDFINWTPQKTVAEYRSYFGVGS